MFYMMLLLILLIGITFTLLGLPDQSGEQSPTSAHPVLSKASAQDFRSCSSKRRGLFKLAGLR